MDDIDKRRMNHIKERLVNILESGKVSDPNSQYELVDATVIDLLQFKDKTINAELVKYLDDQQTLKKDIENKQKDLQKLMDEYGDNVKDVYEMIKKL